MPSPKDEPKTAGETGRAKPLPRTLSSNAGPRPRLSDTRLAGRAPAKTITSRAIRAWASPTRLAGLLGTSEAWVRSTFDPDLPRTLSLQDLCAIATVCPLVTIQIGRDLEGLAGDAVVAPRISAEEHLDKIAGAVGARLVLRAESRGITFAELVTLCRQLDALVREAEADCRARGAA